MQQPAPSPDPAPPPPAAPAPPAAQAPPAPSAISLPDGPIPLEALPRNAQEVRGLRERREILRDQLERATNRREQLVNQLEGEGEARVSAEARAGIQDRLRLIDERINQIERDQAHTERLLSQTPPAVLASLAQEQRRVDQMVDEDEAVASAFGAFGFGVLLTLVIGRIRRRMVRRRGGPAATTATASATLAADPRFDQLAHAVNSIAEEVERIGEGQRFVTQLLASRPEARALTGDPEQR